MTFAIFGASGGISIFINLLVLFLVLVYFALVYWTYLDAKRRLDDPVLIACATAAALFPFLGTVVYTILRPPEFLDDVHERDLEIRASELRLRELIEQSCPHCEYPIEKDYLRCPNCERKVKDPCRNCRKPLDPKWGVCPYCETEVRKAKPEASDGGRRGGAGGDRAARRAERQRRAEQQQQRQPQPPSQGAGEQRPVPPQDTQPSSGNRPGAERQDGGQQNRPGEPARPAPPSTPRP
jgi:double zinc ribbon protein